MNANFNRLGNCHNIYQGKAKKVLCVCSAGLLRSPTAANILHREYGYNTRACGVVEKFALVVLDEVLLEWADEVVFMDAEHEREAREKYPNKLKEKVVFVLNVPDRYEYMDEELQSIILKYFKDGINLYEYTYI